MPSGFPAHFRANLGAIRLLQHPEELNSLSHPLRYVQYSTHVKVGMYALPTTSASSVYKILLVYK